MQDAPQQFDVDMPMAPVILPLAPSKAAKSRSEASEAVAEERGRFHNPEASAPAAASSGMSHLPIKRFAFPEVSEPSDGSRVVWPKCPDIETEWACSETAEWIVRQLPPGRPAVIAVTSPVEGDGKTGVVAFLAPQLIRRIAGGVLVVDANSHHPSLSTRLVLPAEQAMAQSTLIYPTNLPRLNVLPAPTKPQPQRLDRAWIEELREGWSLVLLDMPSMAHPEVAPLIACCDGAYLVVRLGYTPRRKIAKAARAIRGSGGQLLGCVVIE